MEPRALRDNVFNLLKPYLRLQRGERPMLAPSVSAGPIDDVKQSSSYSIGRVVPVLECLVKCGTVGSEGVIEVAEKAGIPSGDAEGWLERVNIIGGLRTQKPRSGPDPDGKPRPMPRHLIPQEGDQGGFKLTALPGRRSDREDVPALSRMLGDAMRTERARAKRLIEQWLLRMHRSSSAFPIDTPEQLGEWLPLLTRAIPIERWRITLCPLEGRDLDDQLALWAAYGQCPVFLHKRKTFRDRRKFPDGKVELNLRSRAEAEIVDSQSVSAPSPSHGTHSTGEEAARRAEKYSTAAPRFVFFYAAIIHLDTRELRELAAQPPADEEQLPLDL